MTSDFASIFKKYDEALQRTDAHPADERIRIVHALEDVIALKAEGVRSVIFMPELPQDLKDEMERVDSLALPLIYDQKGLPTLGVHISIANGKLSGVRQEWPEYISLPVQQHICLAANAFSRVTAQKEQDVILGGFDKNSHLHTRTGLEFLEAALPHVDDIYLQLHATFTRHPDQTLELYAGQQPQSKLDQENKSLTTRFDLARHKKAKNAIAVAPGAIVLMKGSHGSPAQAHSGPLAEPGKQRLSVLMVG